MQKKVQRVLAFGMNVTSGSRFRTEVLAQREALGQFQFSRFVSPCDFPVTVAVAVALLAAYLHAFCARRLNLRHGWYSSFLHFSPTAAGSAGIADQIHR